MNVLRPIEETNPVHSKHNFKYINTNTILKYWMYQTFLKILSNQCMNWSFFRITLPMMLVMCMHR